MFGVHIDSDPTKIGTEIEKYHNMGCKVIQLFVDPFYKRKIEYELFKTYADINKMNIVVHISYVINSAQEWNYHSWWIKQFIMEIESAEKMDAFSVVVHLGKQLDISREEAINNMFTSLLYVHDQTKSTKVKILIETSSGQGSEMCYRLNDFAHFFRKFANHRSNEIRERFGICLDTCHIFAAGYDIRTTDVIKSFFNSFEEMIGIKHIKLIHLNDSKKDLGSNVDRHHNIGRGFIGKNGLKSIIKIFGHLGVPIILETPDEYVENDLKFVKKIIKI
jgi:deoxyribonuclease-4